MNGIFFCSLVAITWPYGKLLMRICDLVFMAHEWSKSKFSVIPILALGYCYYVTNIKIQNKVQKREEKGEKESEEERERKLGFVCISAKISTQTNSSAHFRFYAICAGVVSIRSGASIELVSVLLHLKAVSANKMNNRTVCQIRCICTFFIKLLTLFRNYKMNEILIASTP